MEKYVIKFVLACRNWWLSDKLNVKNTLFSHQIYSPEHWKSHFRALKFQNFLGQNVPWDPAPCWVGYSIQTCWLLQFLLKPLYSILSYISCSFFSFWSISFSWLHSIWCSSTSMLRIGWKYHHRCKNLLFFPSWSHISQNRTKREKKFLYLPLAVFIAVILVGQKQMTETKFNNSYSYN